jgi:Protein of unknown function (DUF2809)
MNNKPARSRLVYAALILVVIALGLASRAQSVQQYLPRFVSEYAGDTLWALTAFLVCGFLLPKLSTWRVTVLALSFAVLIECSQLYHAPWLEALRHTRLGGLVLGFGFLWSDLLCYAAGVAGGVGLELISRRPGRQPPSRL